MAIAEIETCSPEPGRASESARILIRELGIRNLLSFGPAAQPVPLGSLNVIIGPNGSGKSNFIDTLRLLQTAPGAMSSTISDEGGIGEWIYKEASGPAIIEAIVNHPGRPNPLRHLVSFKEEAQRFRLVDERIENQEPQPGQKDVFFYYRFQNGRPVASANGNQRSLKLEEAEIDTSILAQRRDPDLYPEITYLGQQYKQMRVYKNWVFGRRWAPSGPQPSDLPNDVLQEDFRNLGLVMNRLWLQPHIRDRLVEGIRDFIQDTGGYQVLVQGGTVQLFLEEDKFPIPATRLSDGTLRYLCLLVILLHPSPPPLVCIEEPELGLHPDILPGLVDLMIDSSWRTQLIVTTHSDIIIDALSEHPETILTCEKVDGSTVLKRLEKDKLKPWLEKYRLGQLWISGELGAKRW